MLDKLYKSKSSNKITKTEFLTTYKQSLLENELIRIKENNFYFYGGYKNSEYKILIFYPDKFANEFERLKIGKKEQYRISLGERYLKEILKIIRIKLPKETIGKYEHKNYLSAIMKFGIGRERIGDIIASNEGADIIVLNENAEYLKNSLKDLTRFKKADIEIVDIDEIKENELKFEEFTITVNSNRLDNFVSEITRNSRNKTEEIIKAEKVFINSKGETKQAKELKINDIIVIRGSGKYRIKEFGGFNKKKKMIYKMEKYN